MWCACARWSPRATGDALDLHGDVSLAADHEHLVEALPVAFVPGHEEVVGEQRRVVVEARDERRWDEAAGLSLDVVA
jgi:hypothetical protein